MAYARIKIGNEWVNRIQEGILVNEYEVIMGPKSGAKVLDVGWFSIGKKIIKHARYYGKEVCVEYVE